MMFLKKKELYVGKIFMDSQMLQLFQTRVSAETKLTLI